MRHVLPTLLTCSVLLSGTIVEAQPRGDRGPTPHSALAQPEDRAIPAVDSVNGLASKINDAARRGRISWSRARELREEVRRAQPLAWKVDHGRASWADRKELNRIVNHIESGIIGRDQHR